LVGRQKVAYRGPVGDGVLSGSGIAGKRLFKHASQLQMADTGVGSKAAGDQRCFAQLFTAGLACAGELVLCRRAVDTFAGEPRGASDAVRAGQWIPDRWSYWPGKRRKGAAAAMPFISPAA